MDNNTVKNILDGLTSRGVLSADGRRLVMTVMLEQKKEHMSEVSLLKNTIEGLRSSRNAAIEEKNKLEIQLTSIKTKKKK